MEERPLAEEKRASPPLPRVWVLTAIFFAALLVSFVLQLPTWQVADWQQYAFYDTGTTLKGDMLLARGYVPTVDFGYTHGLLSLFYGRVGFGVLGRTPFTFMALTLLTEGVMGWALARILVAAGISRKGVLVLLAALPMAIMPTYLTLTHPLEAMLILLGLAAQAEGKRAQALALATVCLFVKPSMGYVYGAVLLTIIVWNIVRHVRVPMVERILSILRQFVPAALTAATLFLLLSWWMGFQPVLRTLLPTTGARTYGLTGFGFFTKETREFWLPAKVSDVFLTPALVYLLAVAGSAAGAIWSAWMLIRRRVEHVVHIVSRQRAYELLMTAGILNTAFVLGFYGWKGSWAYYSYLPSLGLALLLVLLPVRRDVRRVMTVALIALLLLSHAQLIGTIYDAWQRKTRLPEAGGLWTYPEKIAEWQQAVDATQGSDTVVMTNGWIPQLRSNITMPDAWFPELGIPTAKELERVKEQVAKAQCVILWPAYRHFEDVWYSSQIEPLHRDFEPVMQGRWFTVLRRVGR